MHILYGSRPSFYTRKAWVAMRLLGLEVDDRLNALAVKAEVEAAVGGYHRFPVVQCPDGRWLKDSTAIARSLSAEAPPTRSLLPDDPALAVMVLMLEDWLDEWFLRPTIAWRAVDPETRSWVARVGAMNLFGLDEGDAMPDALAGKLEKAAGNVAQFFTAAGAVNGVTTANRADMAALVDVAVDALEAVLADAPFLAGGRPSIADAALWGFLEAGLLWEPKPKAHVAARAPALVAFQERMAARAAEAGVEGGGWDTLDTVARRLRSILRDGMGYAAFLAANRDGAGPIIADGAPMARRRFTERNRQALGAEIAALPGTDRARLDAVAGDWPLFQAYCAE